MLLYPEIQALSGWNSERTKRDIMAIKGEATVVKHTGSHYMLAQLPDWNMFPAVLRGKIRLKGSSATNPVAVGDRVTFEADIPDEAFTNEGQVLAEDGRKVSLEYMNLENPAAITAVKPRSNYIIRKSTNLSRQSHIIAANLDRAFLVVTLDFPQVKLPFLDRLLVTCEVYNVPATIVLNKCDLYGPEHEDMRAAFHEIYEGAGYPVLEVSAHTGEGVELLRDMVSGKLLPDGTPNENHDPSKPVVSLFSGVSGVGKSSLIKALDPALEPRVGDISDAHEQGRHTTTFYEMYSLATGGFIVDTPGLRGFGLVDLKKEEIALYFPEMLKVSEDCRFAPCTHTHEPGCAVKEAVENGDITYDRYSSYLGMLEEEGKYR
jgi:ribosome biogenesis GTPase